MPIKIKNWKLALLALLFICLFTALGCWQVSRGKQKKALLASFALRRESTPLAASDLDPARDLRFYRATLSGRFDNAHTLLLDNKTAHGQIGYEIYTPFYADGLSHPLLVDRGFIPMGRSRAILPDIRRGERAVTITGLINQPPGYVALGQLYDGPALTFPLRIEYVNLAELAKVLNMPLFPYVLNLQAQDPAAYAVEWQIVTMGPERHWGYALQWFALALTLLILFVVLNRSPRESRTK